MRQTLKARTISWMLVLVMVLSVVSPGGTWKASAQKAYDGYVYVTVERLTLGQGFAQEPVKAGYYKEDSVEDILKRAFGDKLIFTTSSWGAYMSGYADGGEPAGWTVDNIPQKIKDVLGSSLTKESKRADATKLSENDYVKYSGYSFSVNNVFPNVGMSGVKYSEQNVADTFQNGSVIRVQFSLYYGDLKITPSEYGKPMIDFANKDELIKKVAEYKGNKKEQAYADAVAALEDWDATTVELEDAQKALEEAEKKPESTSISKVSTPDKKQIKLTWKKKSDVTGYQIEVSTSSKFKKSKTKVYKVAKAKTTSRTIKSLKSKKKYYVRIRTYKKIKENGKSVTRYSDWSKQKTVKVK